MIVRSTKQCSCCFTCFASFNQTENKWGSFYQHFILKMRKLRHRGINEVMNNWKRCILVSIFIYTSKRCRKGTVQKNRLLFSLLKKKKQQIKCVAAAAKLLQSCPTLCYPIDGSPPGFPVPGILQARTLEWVAISFSNARKWKVKVKSLCCNS